MAPKVAPTAHCLALACLKDDEALAKMLTTGSGNHQTTTKRKALHMLLPMSKFLKRRECSGDESVPGFKHKRKQHEKDKAKVSLDNNCAIAPASEVAATGDSVVAATDAGELEVAQLRVRVEKLISSGTEVKHTVDVPSWKPGDPVPVPPLISFKKLMENQAAAELALEKGEKVERNMDADEDDGEQDDDEDDCERQEAIPEGLAAIGKRDVLGEVIRSMENRLARHGLLAAPNSILGEKMKKNNRYIRKTESQEQLAFYDRDDDFIDDAELEQVNKDDAVEQDSKKVGAEALAEQTIAQSDSLSKTLGSRVVGASLDLTRFRLTGDEISETSSEEASDDSSEGEEQGELGRVENGPPKHKKKYSSTAAAANRLPIRLPSQIYLEIHPMEPIECVLSQVNSADRQIVNCSFDAKMHRFTSLDTAARILLFSAISAKNMIVPTKTVSAVKKPGCGWYHFYVRNGARRWSLTTLVNLATKMGVSPFVNPSGVAPLQASKLAGLEVTKENTDHQKKLNRKEFVNSLAMNMWVSCREDLGKIPCRYHNAKIVHLNYCFESNSVPTFVTVQWAGNSELEENVETRRLKPIHVFKVGDRVSVWDRGRLWTALVVRVQHEDQKDLCKLRFVVRYGDQELIVGLDKLKHCYTADGSSLARSGRSEVWAVAPPSKPVAEHAALKVGEKVLFRISPGKPWMRGRVTQDRGHEVAISTFQTPRSDFVVTRDNIKMESRGRDGSTDAQPGAAPLTSGSSTSASTSRRGPAKPAAEGRTVFSVDDSD